MRYALINTDGLCVQVIVWNGTDPYQVPDGLMAVEIIGTSVTDDNGDTIVMWHGGVGWTYDGTNWTAPPVENEEGEG